MTCRWIRVDNLLHWTVGYHAYTYVLGALNVCHWRGVWVLLDYYTGVNVVSVWTSFAIGWLRPNVIGTVRVRSRLYEAVRCLSGGLSHSPAAAACGGFAAVGPENRRYRSIVLNRAIQIPHLVGLLLVVIIVTFVCGRGRTMCNVVTFCVMLS